MRISKDDRGNQTEYNQLLDTFGGKNKSRGECVNHLLQHGFTYNQANNAVHVYQKGGVSKAIQSLTKEERDRLLHEFGASGKTNKECVDYLMQLGYTYRQANTASYQFRKEHGLIGLK
jgi:hypothetical protein